MTSATSGVMQGDEHAQRRGHPTEISEHGLRSFRSRRTENAERADVSRCCCTFRPLPRLVGFAAVWGLAACRGDPFAAPTVPVDATASPGVADLELPQVTLRVAGFSAAREVIKTRLLKTFAAEWERSHRQRLDVQTRFGGSDALVEAMASAFPADVAVLASPRTVDALLHAGVHANGWRQQPYGGIVCRSLVVLAVRKGNPKNIRNWADLTRPDVRIVTPDPLCSGGGAWNQCAIYGAALRGHAGVSAGDREAARDFLSRVAANVVAHAGSASESFRGFQDGVGDVAIAYECEVTSAWLFGHDEERVIPSSTVLVENPVLLFDRHADAHGTRLIADALLAFLFSPTAQQRLASCGLRPVDPTVAAACAAQFPEPQDLWTIDALGGWERAAIDVLGEKADRSVPASPGS